MSSEHARVAAPPAPTHNPAGPIAPAPGSPGTARDDLRCPLCEYDLRGLTEPCCPECGYRFAWADLTDPAKRLHPYLFEHHPERNVVSFVRTHLNAVRPKRFWTSLLPAQPSFPRRLVLYWCVGAAFLALAMAAHYALWSRGYARHTEAARARLAGWYRPGTPSHRGMMRHLESNYPPPPSAAFFNRAWHAEGRWTLWLAAVLLAWPWATFLTLLVFRVSMRRARIRPIHVLRCALYSVDAYVWIAAAVGAVVAYRAVLTWGGPPPPPRLALPFLPPAPVPTGLPFGYRSDMVPDTLFWLGTASLVFAAYRLAAAFRLYLKFDHPVATVLASQVIVALAAVLTGLKLLVN